MSSSEQGFDPVVLLDAGMSVVPIYSAADDAAIGLLRNPSALIDALKRTREAFSCRVPALGPQMAVRLWAWPVTSRATAGGFDVQTERLRALRAVDAQLVDRALAAPEREWYFMDCGDRLGPLSESDLRELVAAGRIHGDAWVWAQGMAEWQPAGRVFRASSPHSDGWVRAVGSGENLATMSRLPDAAAESSQSMPNPGIHTDGVPRGVGSAARRIGHAAGDAETRQPDFLSSVSELGTEHVRHEMEARLLRP